MAKKTTTGKSQPLPIRALILACGLLVLAEFIIHRHAYFELEATPLFFALMGAFSMIAVAAISAVLRRLLIRPEDYYDRRHDEVNKGGKNA